MKGMKYFDYKIERDGLCVSIHMCKRTMTFSKEENPQFLIDLSYTSKICVLTFKRKTYI